MSSGPLIVSIPKCAVFSGLVPNASMTGTARCGMLRLEFAPRFVELGVDAAGFDAFLHRCFAQKRKTLANNLRAASHAGPPVVRIIGEVVVSADRPTKQIEASAFDA